MNRHPALLLGFVIRDITERYGKNKYHIAIIFDGYFTEKAIKKSGCDICWGFLKSGGKKCVGQGISAR